MRLQLRLEIAKISAAITVTNHADDADDLTVDLCHVGLHGAALAVAIVSFEIELRGLPRDYLRRLLAFSIDSMTAKAASTVAGRGAAACRHILESVSQSPPKEKSSSW